MGSRGPLANVCLWVELLQLMEEIGDWAQWPWAPSHVGLEGNEIANVLAVQGICPNPLWRIVRGKVLRVPREGVVEGPG